MSPPIYTPDGSEVSEIVLPDGSTASQVIGPGGSVVFEAGPDIPDSGVEQWTAVDYDSQNDEFVGQLGGFNLSGGSSTGTTDANGNTVREFSGSDGQEYTNANISVSYDRISLILVLNPDNTNVQDVWSGVSDSSVYGQLDGGGFARSNFGDRSGDNGSSGSSLALYLFDGQLVNGTPENILEENGTLLSTQTDGQSGFDGFILGNFTNGGYGFDGDFYEAVVYQDATDSELSAEKIRLKNKYSGLSF